MAATGDSSLTELISKLKYSQSSKTLIDSLTKLRSEFIRRSDGVENFRKLGGLKPLLDLISRPNERIVDVSMSILANCCLEEETRKKIKQLNGIPSIVSILKSLKQSSILNRTSRALANLAVDSDIAEDIHKEAEILSTLVELLKNSEDNECRQSVIRALKNLSKTDKHREAIVDAGGIQTIAELLTCKHTGVIVSSVRALAEITKSCSLNCAQQITDADGFQPLVELMGHTKTVIREHAVLSLFNLMVHGIVRPSVGNAGGVKAFIADVKKATSTATLSVQLLCLSCREVVNRVKVRQLGGLELMIDMLKNDEHSTHHETIIASFLYFVYDEPSLKVMVANDVVSVFLSHLHKTMGQSTGAEETQSIDSSDSEKLNTECEPERNVAKLSGYSKSEVNNVEITPNVEEVACTSTATSGASMNSNPTSHPFVSPTHSSPAKRQGSIGGAWETPTNSNSTNRAYSPYMSPLSDTSDKTSAYLSPTYSPSYLNNLSPQWSPQGSVYSVYSDTEPDYLVNPQMSPIHSSDATEGTPTDRVCDPWNTASLAELHVDDDETESMTDAAKDKQNSHEQEKLNEKESEQSCEGPRRGVNVDHDTSPDVLKDDTPKSKVKTNIEYPEPKGIQHNILIMLSRLSQMDDPSTILITKSCIKSLLKYIVSNATVSNRAIRILTRLIRNPHCFEAIVNNYMPSLIHLLLETTLKNTQDENLNSDFEESYKSESSDDQLVDTPKKKDVRKACTMIAEPLLKNLSIQGETPYGQGVVAHSLLAGSDMERTAAAVALPFLYRNTKLRKKMLLDYSGLKTLVDVIKNMSRKDEEVVTMAIEALCHLAKDVIVTDDAVSFVSRQQESLSPSTSPLRKKFKRDCGTERDESMARKDQCFYKDFQDRTDILLRVENHRTVAANRQLLSDKSSVFAAMLSGSYVESTQNDISIDEVSYHALLFLVHYLYDCENCPTMLQLLDSSHRQSQDLELDILACADRFMLPELLAAIQNVVIERHLNFDSVVDLYNYCHLHHCNSLQRECLQFILCKDATSLSTRLLCFQQICQSKNYEVIFNEIFSLIETLVK